MMRSKLVGLAFAASCLTGIGTISAHAQMAGTYSATPGDNGPQSYSQQANQGDMNQGDMSQSAAARRNVIESERYDRSLEANRKFRQARMRKECGPITDSQLHQSCLASFNQNEPYMGSSTSRRSHRSESGR